MAELRACLQKNTCREEGFDCVGDDPPVCTLQCGRADLGFAPNAAGDACEPVVTKYVQLDARVQPECELGAGLTHDQSVIYSLQ